MKRSKIKIKKTKRCKACGKEFRPFRSTEKFCGYECAATEIKPKKQANQSIINQVSDKRKRQIMQYRLKRKFFLSQKENMFCPVMAVIYNLNARATEIHHKAGRTNNLLNHTPYWLAVSSQGHEWIHNNVASARALGFLINSSTVSLV